MIYVIYKKTTNIKYKNKKKLLNVSNFIKIIKIKYLYIPY